MINVLRLQASRSQNRWKYEAASANWETAMTITHSRGSAFTMVELLVILAILAFVLGVLFPFFMTVRSVSARQQSTNNMRQQILALHNCEAAFKGMPPIVGAFPAQNNSQGTLFFYLLPFLEQDNLYRQAEGSVWKNGTLSTPLSVFLDPRDKTAPPGNRYKGWLATSNYAANWLVFKDTGTGIAQITDGTSNTIGLTERYQMCHGAPCAWGYSSISTWTPMFAYYNQGKFQVAPNQEECNPALPQSMDRAAIQVALLDGSTRMVNEQISPETWWHACTPNGGEVLGADW
jgi:type II secretory pathway pseudopilin PulG